MRRLFLLTGFWLVLSLPASAQPQPDADQVEFFEKRVRPVLAEHCLKCHGADEQKAGLRLDERASAISGGDLGPAIVPGDLEESLLVSAIRYDDDFLKMPPKGKLSREQVDDLSTWVKTGAFWPGETATSGSESVPPRRPGLEVTDADRAHWAFQKVRRPALPEVADPAWVRNPVDAFLLSKLDQNGVAPNPPAQPHELLRRLYFDLTGLPPTPEEVASFLSDHSPDAYEKVVDRLLQSPRYGEKWARHWLDLVRYAETNSYERDNPKPHAWRYRDYVIRALNDDKPYDQFLTEQLAGDELPDAGNDALIATGFYRLCIWDDEPTDRDLAFYDGLDDIVATTGQVFLGLTIDCARCHDHKIDPIPQRDYYRLLAFFQNINHFRNGGPTDEAPLFENLDDKAAYEAASQERAHRIQNLEAEVDEIREEFLQKYEAEVRAQQAENDQVDRRSLARAIRTEGARVLGPARFARYEEVRKTLDGLQGEVVPVARALMISESGPTPEPTHILLRGLPQAKGDPVEPGFPVVLDFAEPVLPAPSEAARTTGRRLALAAWITRPENPLTARVMVNRLWQHHFGRGIVRSPNNFGTQGDAPTHPELLDWLAAELVDQGWRLKPIHRLIVTSNAYRMSSRVNPAALAQDPANDLFWRFDMRRLTAEELRDAILCLTGSLNPAQHGPSVYPEIPREVLEGQSQPGKGWPTSAPDDQNRRSIYVHVKRSLLLPILEVFDAAETDRSSPSRFSTTQPAQSLLMLNSQFMSGQAKLLAQRLEREAGDDLQAQIRLAFELAIGRPPTQNETRRALGFLEALQQSEGMTRADARETFALLVLNLNEFVYLD